MTFQISAQVEGGIGIMSSTSSIMPLHNGDVLIKIRKLDYVKVKK
jgi:uncharacterized protein (DUF39 family)